MQRSAGCANSIKADSCSRKFLGTPNSLRLTARQISQSCKDRRSHPLRTHLPPERQNKSRPDQARKDDSCSRKFLGTPNSLRLTARQISQSCKDRRSHPLRTQLPPERRSEEHT